MRTGRVILLTGAAGGIGAVVTAAFLTMATPSSRQTLPRSDCIPCGHPRARPELLTVCGDVSSETDVQAIAAFARARAGKVDVLINCAGYFPCSRS